jgi:hypothetical protein
MALVNRSFNSTLKVSTFFECPNIRSLSENYFSQYIQETLPSDNISTENVEILNDAFGLFEE